MFRILTKELSVTIFIFPFFLIKPNDSFKQHILDCDWAIILDPLVTE